MRDDKPWIQPLVPGYPKPPYWPKKEITEQELKDLLKPRRSKNLGKLKTYVAIILDKSYSMEQVRDATISGYNEEISVLKNKAKGDGDWYFSFITFNENVDPVLWNQPVSTLQEANRETYVPNGRTAMYDAVGYTIERLMRETNYNDPNVSYLLIVMSDGLENASRKWTQRALAEKIQELKATERWTITYLGANQDLSKIQQDLNLYSGNIMAYTSDVAGTTKAFGMMANATARYAAQRAVGMSASADFYNPKQEDELSSES